MITKWTLLCLLGSLFGALLLKAQPAACLLHEPIDSLVELDAYTSIYIDSNRTVDLAQARQKWHSGAFQPLATLHYPGKLQSGKYHYWLQFQLENTSPDTLHLIFRLQRLDSSFYYQLVDGEVERSVLFGNALSMKAIEKLDLPLPSISSLPIHLPPHSVRQVFVRTSDELYLTDKIRPRLESPYYFVQEMSWRQFDLLLVDGFFLGMLFIIMVFSLLQYFQNKDKAFLFYSGYVLILFVINWLRFDYTNFSLKIFHQYFGHSYGIKVPLEVLSYIAYTAFVHFFLNEDRRYPKLLQFVRFALLSFGVYFLVSVMLSLIEVRWSWIINYYARIVLSIYIFVFLYLLSKIKSPLAWYLFYGTLSLALLSILAPILFSFTLQDKKWLGKDFTYLLAQAGIVIELLFFSLGLGYKRYLSDRAKIKAQEEKAQLEELEALKDRLYTNITHEFRTPLTVILGMARQLKNNVKSSVTNTVELIERNGNQLLQLVNQLLALAKLESGQLQLNPKQADIIAYLTYLTASFSSFAERKDIQLEFSTTEDSFLMDFDPKALQQVFSNLMSNALKFTSEGGEVRVHVTVANEDSLEFKVADTGQGIEAAALPHIFDRFYQVDATAIREEEGTGIGLALTKELVDLMQGDIRVESKVGKGSTFTICLPVSRKAALSKEPIEPVSSSSMVDDSLPDYTAHPLDLPLVLLIEDHSDVAQYLRMVLQNKYQCLHAANGLAGLEMAVEKIPDLVICDVMLPKMDGFEVCRRLKNDERTNHIPVIMLTAKAEHGDKLTGLSKGADAYLRKPFEEEELLLRMEKLLALRRQLQQKYSQQLIASTPVPKTEAPPEDFLQKAEHIVLENLENESFGSGDLAKALFLSRSQVHRKLKALTGQSTSIYIRLLRLRQAKQLLTDTDRSITDIAFQVGFKSPVYFSQIYKDTFGESPTESRK